MNLVVSNQRVIIVVVLLFTLESAKGSKINFTASSSFVQPSLTKILTLRCSLVDSPPGSSSLVDRSVSSTTDNFTSIRSIDVSKDGENIATVSNSNHTVTTANHANINVSGSVVLENATEMGFLEVVINHPAETKGENYSCRVVGTDDLGETVVLSATLSVDVSTPSINMSTPSTDVSTPSINDLVQHIYNMDRFYGAKIAELETYIRDQDQRHNRKIARLEQKYQEDIVYLNSEVATLKGEQKSSNQHVEQGIVDCESLGNNGQFPVSRNYSVNFKKPYDKAPVVFLSLLDMSNEKQFESYYRVKLMGVDNDGFTVKVDVEDETNYVNYLQASWLSLPTL